MTGKAVRPEVVEIDPLFYIPDGVDELKYRESFISSDGNLDSDDDSDDDSDVDTDAADSGIDDTDYSDDPETPQILDVASQTIHVTDTGAEVVDVVFDVSDVTGYTSFELRVDKL